MSIRILQMDLGFSRGERITEAFSQEGCEAANLLKRDSALSLPSLRKYGCQCTFKSSLPPTRNPPRLAFALSGLTIDICQLQTLT